MNKSKTNLSVVNAAGIRINPSIVVGEQGTYSSGDILDANATEQLVKNKVSEVVGSAAEALDTLEELGDALPTKVSDLLNDLEFVTETLVSEITDKIPTLATSQNQLADKEFVNSSISTNTADFKGTYDLVTDLSNDLTTLNNAILASQYSTPNNNDYCFVSSVDADGNTVYSRYKYTIVDNVGSWDFEYNLNNSSFTAAQWGSIQSGITSSLVSKLLGLPSSNLVQSTSINNIVVISLSDYLLLLTKDPNTEYNIV